ncbi:transmembrane protein, putative (macronuclear) [Tetrahymena thermophila SB210]|uniref:Transmembrane protein, putative n=1 Tax=Tetrahymena thermophila (strain SB210) TaxID=312017 RepID=Q22D24_TETTS|nr:transmembrane protein, putative [Tetrahymena thermophila SB210]EAR83165.1 transmembrane protein, putative [Tetrahymena thermophila SB210]|eukprot:XP_001030828.1 transmembrane protein, putative [Tetrahymena thermophila SB210]
MLIQNLDLFSQHFQFNFGHKQTKKATLFGSFLSVIVVVTALAYFIYMINEYATNQLQPNFKQQSFVSEQNIELDIKNDLVGYKFNYGNPQLKNQNYFVVLAFFAQKVNNNSTIIPLNTIECSHPSLAGYMCFDFSNLPYTKINFDSKNNIQSQIRIFTYGCRDIDFLKTQEGVNCASQKDIDSMIDNYSSSISLKLFTSQYNTTSQQMQTNYRNLGMPTNSNLNVISQIKAQKQVTSVKEGVFVQSQSTYTSPISYDQQTLTLDRKNTLQQSGIGSFSMIYLYLDELVFETDIQFLTLPSILANINSIFSLLMILGYFGRAISLKYIQKDFFMLFLKNLFMEDYLHILKSNNLHVEIDQQQQKQFQKIELRSNQDEIEFKIDYEREENFFESAMIPEFSNKPKKSLDLKKATTDTQNYLNNKGTPFNQSIIQKKQDNSTQTQLQQEVRFFSVQENTFNPESPNQTLQQMHQKSSNFSNVFLDSGFQSSAQKIYDHSSKQTSPKSALKRNIIQPNFKNNTINQSILTKEASQAQKQRKESDQYEFAVKKLKIIQDSKISSKIYTMASKFVCFCRNQAAPQINGLDRQKQEFIEQQIMKDLNIINFIKDIIFLKKAIMLMLTKDQHAAIQLIGLSSKFTNLNNLTNFEISNAQLENDFSPYESQFIIAQSKELQERYLQSFLLRCSDEQEEMSNLDLKIFKSLKKICCL